MLNTRKASPLRYEWKCSAPKYNKCVYKFWFGTYYYIGLSKDINQTIAFIASEVDRRIRLGVTPDHIYYNIVQHVGKKINHFKVDIIASSEDHLALLKEYASRLKEARKDEKCLNQSFKPHIPTWVSPDALKAYESYVKPKPKKHATKDTKTIPSRRSSGTKGSVPNSKWGTSGVQRNKKDTGTLKEKPKGTIQRERRKV